MNDAEFCGNNRGGFRMIACNHHWANAGALRERDCIFRLLARRIDHTYQSQEDEVLLEALINRLAPEGILRQRAEGDPERAQRCAGQFFITLPNLRATLRDPESAARRLSNPSNSLFHAAARALAVLVSTPSRSNHTASSSRGESVTTGALLVMTRSSAHPCCPPQKQATTRCPGPARAGAL